MSELIYGWSGGKDSCYGLDEYGISKVDRLFTNVNRDYDRVSIHGVSIDLIEKQANSIGIPLEKIDVSKVESVKDYQEKALEFYKKGDKSEVVFADIFLEDNREKREQVARKASIDIEFPIWKKDTSKMSRDFVNKGFKAILVAVNSKYLDKSYAGREFNKELIEDLEKKGLDTCGEHGEFHTFVWDGPIFDKAIEFNFKGVVEKETEPNTYYYADIEAL